MNHKISNNSVANRRLYLQNVREIVSFSDPAALGRVRLGKGFVRCGTERQEKDIVARGADVLRLTSDGKTRTGMSFSYDFESPLDLTGRSTVFFAFSAYDGEHDSQYFENVMENMYFVEKPDPLLVSLSYLTVRLYGRGTQCERTVQLTNYGYNKIYLNFSGEELLSGVERLEAVYDIEEAAPQWQGVCKLDTVCAGMAVDFTFRGSGMECLFRTENGTAAHRDGALTFRFGKSSALEFPDLTDAAGTVYDVFLPVKNTVVARISSGFDELPLRLYFKTEQDGVFAEDKSKEFTVRGARREQTVFWNLSDLPGCAGRLTGLRLVPFCADGELVLRKIAFEQEHKLAENAGSIVSCTADGERIRFACEAGPEYEGCALKILETHPDFLRDDPSTLPCVAEGVIRGGQAELFAPYRKEKITRIASQFLAMVRKPDGTFVRLGERAMISNWRGLCGGNPYEFALPAREVRVTDAPYLARGDGFSDDTDAIQAAVDAVSAAGGGRVTLPGSADPYGRRYVATNLTLGSCVDLHLEKGAVLWQADDITYYRRLPRFGHNVAMTGVNWPANHTSGNLPFVYAFRRQRVKVTGEGTIRMCDTESASEDGLFSYIGDNVCIGCCDRMHVVPLALDECEEYEISDVSILRSSGVNLFLNRGRRGFVGNVFISEVKCTGADGMWPMGSDGVKFTRVVLNNNDDGICLSSNYNDPRDVLWEFCYPGAESGTHHIELSHSYFHCHTFTASAISFCTWGTDAPDLGLHEVSDIDVFDTSLQGRVSVGGWTDNPYYGVFPFDASEKDDFSPVKNFRLRSCDLQSPLGISPLRITNCENDVGFRSPSDFEYGDFLRRPAERNPGWRAGLANWSYSTRRAVEQILLYGDACAMLKPVSGEPCDLYQGLYLEAGEYRFTFRSKAAGRFNAFVRGTDGAEIASLEFREEPGSYRRGCPWNPRELIFTVPADGLYRAGFACTYEDAVVVYVTGCRMERL